MCLSLFPWAKIRQHKAVVKMHTLLDLHGNIPTFISITVGKCMTLTSSTRFCQKPERYMSWTCGYTFERLYGFTLSSAFSVVRTKSNVLLQRRCYFHKVE